MQSLWALMALLAGPSSDIYVSYLWWMPAGNHGRALLKVAYALIFAALPLLVHHRRRVLLVASTGMVLGAAAGVALGMAEDGFHRQIHYPRVALLDTVQMMSLLGALLVLLVRHAVDRVLWVSLAAYALRDGLNGLWFSAMAWLEVHGVWAPSRLLIGQNFVISILVYSAMIGFGLHRLLLARRGVHVPSLLEPLTAKQVSSFP